MSGSSVVRSGPSIVDPRLGAIAAVHAGGSSADRPRDAHNHAVYLNESEVAWIAQQFA